VRRYEKSDCVLHAFVSRPHSRTYSFFFDFSPFLSVPHPHIGVYLKLKGNAAPHIVSARCSGPFRLDLAGPAIGSGHLSFTNSQGLSTVVGSR
jgi:hypothetical protein